MQADALGRSRRRCATGQQARRLGVEAEEYDSAAPLGGRVRTLGAQTTVGRA